MRNVRRPLPWVGSKHSFSGRSDNRVRIDSHDCDVMRYEFQFRVKFRMIQTLHPVDDRSFVCSGVLGV